MKRTIVFLSVFALLLSLCGCQKTPVANGNPTQAPTTPTGTQPIDPTIPVQTVDPRVVEMQELLEYKDRYDLYNYALLSEFSSPADVNIRSLFPNGIKNESKNLTNQERELLKSWLSDYTNGIYRFPVEKINAALTEVFGITLDQTNRVGMDFMRYYEETDCYYGSGYYIEHVDVNVQRVVEQNDGTLKVYYRRGRGNYQDMIVTLKPAGESYQILSNVYYSPMLGEMQNLFDERSGQPFYNEALFSTYETPADVDLFYLFYNGFKDESQSPTEQELELLEGRMGQFWKEMDLFRLPTEKMNNVLRELYGITLEQTNGVGLDSFVYLEETDCYYTAHTGMYAAEDLTVRNVETQDDGSLLVQYSYYKGDYIVRLMPIYGGGYRILSNFSADPEIAKMQVLLQPKNRIDFYSDALTSMYSVPADVNLLDLFQDGFWDEEQTPTKEELLLLDGKLDQNWKECDLIRLPAGKVDAVLTELFGITLEQTNGVGLDKMVYIEQTDSYYFSAPAVRTNRAAITVDSVENQTDGCILVQYFQAFNGNCVVRLMPTQNGGYRILSNLQI